MVSYKNRNVCFAKWLFVFVGVSPALCCAVVLQYDDVPLSHPQGKVQHIVYSWLGVQNTRTAVAMPRAMARSLMFVAGAGRCLIFACVMF